MPMLYARCPTTRAIIETGVESDEDSLKIMRHTKFAVRCETCGTYHTMRVDEMFCAAEDDESSFDVGRLRNS